MQRQVELKVTYEEKSHIIAKNCYVFEVNPQLKRDTKGAKMYVKLNIFSMDKLMTLNKYSKAYVARKLGSGIIKPESLKFGLKADGQTPLVESDISTLIHLKYDERLGGKATIPSEFIQPYLVQYNESFYDFLVRTANRCGEFLFFEDGRLTLGLPRINVLTPYDNIKDYESVVIQNISADPLTIENYSRDSIKDGTEVGDLNHTVIEKEDTGFPEDIFPDEISSNAELSSDEYMFPLVEDKFTKLSREALYDMPNNKVMNSLKTVTMGTSGIVPSVIMVGVNEGLAAAKGAFQVSTTNKAFQKDNITPYSKKLEQAKDGKVVQFATLDPAGWTTIKYYNDIHKNESELQRQIICINMGTNFVPVMLGQKIRVDGLEGNFIVIQIQMNADAKWDVNYDKYDKTADDRYTGNRQQKIYAIPTKPIGNDETYYPPVHPVPVIRKAGPQAAFVTDNNDPKYQGRVRVAYPWQSLGEA